MQEREQNEWTHNVQFLRIEMPALKCRKHHAELVRLVKAFERSMKAQFGKPMVVSCVGFYRADADWDPVEAGPLRDRGMRTAALDNEP